MDLRPKKALGQHFLRHEAICQRIASLLESSGADIILEIGPGPGALTEALEQVPHQSLILLEKDARFAAQRKAAARPRTRCLNLDALDFDWRSLPPGALLAGNLPYNIASRLIWDILARLSGEHAFRKAVFMIQKEVALRICAPPGSRLTGALGIWAQAHARPKLEFSVLPGSFYPPPKVDSAVLSFLPHAVAPQNPDALKTLLAICFEKRRKQILGTLSRAGLADAEDALSVTGISPTARPEQISAKDFVRLADLLAKSLTSHAKKF